MNMHMSPLTWTCPQTNRHMYDLHLNIHLEIEFTISFLLYLMISEINYASLIR
jgi:hypothetical protein